MPSPLHKRRASSKPSGYSPSKRRRKASVEADIIEISDDDKDNNDTVLDDDEELKDLLAQIAAQEQSERYAERLQKQFDLDVHEGDAGPMPGSSTHAPIDVDDAVFAQRLAEKWATEDDIMSIRSFEIENHSSDIEIIDELPAKLPKVKSRGKSHATYNQAPQASTSGSSEAGIHAAPITPDDSLLPYKPIFVDSRMCRNCSKPMALPTGMVSFTDSLCPQSLTKLLHVACRTCKTAHCRGCFLELSCPMTCKGIATNLDCTVHTCCPEIRALALFAILEAFDSQIIQERVSAETRTQALLKKNSVRKAARSVGPGGTGYGTGSSGGRGRGRGQVRQASPSQRNRMGFQDVIIQAFKMLVDFLPAPYSDNPQEYDILPHPSIGYLIALSQLPSTLANLLRNDSVSDWIAQKDTYNTMLSLLRRMADSELTIQCLIGPRWEANQHGGLGNWMRNREKLAWKEDDDGKPDAQPPLYTHFRKLTLQSEAFLKGAQQVLSNDGSESDIGDIIQGTSLAGDIIAARDDLERAISVIGRTLSPDDQQVQSTSKSAKGKGKAISSDPDTLYLEACEKLAFKYISLASEQNSAGGGLLYASFNYATNLKQTENSARHPKDRLHLVKELAVTATSLPAGIWVRIDEVRNDAIKIMMAGPAGTPYAGGLFEFDCFMPIEYPNQAPLVHLRTTGGGSVRFNPNLYNCGKVCLSLLGTWPGRPEEQWTPKSTLLQVLVSIQSMILVEAPYFNEPGHGAVRVDLPASAAYNRNICKETICWAIVEWLKDEHRNGIWRDVIASHFMIHKIKIRRQIVDWIASAPEIRGYTKAYNPCDYYVQGGSGHRAATHLHNNAARRDLLAEFDKGMKSIELWKTGDAVF